MQSRLWFSSTLVALAWLGFGLIQTGGLPFAKPQAHVEVRSVPPGAEVFVNGSPSGMTDGFLAVAPGRVEIRVKKNGFEDSSSTVDVSRTRTPLVAFELKPKDARLEVKADGEAFELWVGPGQPKRQEKHDPCLLEPGLYEVWGVRNGVPSTRKTVRLKSGQTQQLSLTWSGGGAKAEPDSPRVERPGEPVPLPLRTTGEPVNRYIEPPRRYPDPAPQVYREPPPRPYIPSRPVYQPQPVWTPIPAEHSAPPSGHHNSDPAPVFTPLP